MTDGDKCFGERELRGAWECWLGSGGFKSGLEKGLTEKALSKAKRQYLCEGFLNREPKSVGRGLPGEFEDLQAGQCGWSRVTIGKRADDLGS